MRNQYLYLLVMLIFVTVAVPSRSWAADADAARIIRQLLETPPEQVDFAETMFAVDKLVDPSVDVEAGLRQIDAMVSTVQRMAGPGATTQRKLSAIRAFIYDAGEWNGQRPFAYDLDDPLGRKLSNKLLTNYIESRRGNCVTMPALFLILADRMGLNVTLAQAPTHIFLKFTDDEGRTRNLEATSGALPARDEWIRQNFPMTDLAIQNGLYLRALSRSENVALMASTVLEKYAEDKRLEDLVTLADVILKFFPSDVHALIWKGSAYGGIIERDFISKYPRPTDIPPEQRARFRLLDQQNFALLNQAEAMGWRPSP